MPFQSDAQRKYMWAQHPQIAKRWSEEEKMRKGGAKKLNPNKARMMQRFLANQNGKGKSAGGRKNPATSMPGQGFAMGMAKQMKPGMGFMMGMQPKKPKSGFTSMTPQEMRRRRRMTGQ